MADINQASFEIEFEIDPAVPDGLCVKCSTVRRLIAELFNLNLRFMDQFFDTFPIYISPIDLLNILIRIYKNQENILAHDPNFEMNKTEKNKLDSGLEEAASLSFTEDKDEGDSKVTYEGYSIYSSNDLEKIDYKNSMDGDSVSVMTSQSLFKQDTSMSRTINKKLHSHRKTGLTNLDSVRGKQSISPQSIDSAVSSSVDVPDGLKVLKILSYWVTKFYIDFQSNPTLSETLLCMINEIIQSESVDGKNSTALTRATMLKQKLTQTADKYSLTTSGSVESIVNKLSTVQTTTISSSPKQTELSFRKYDVDFIAIGFTQISMKLQKKVNIRELLNVAWTKENRNEIAASILAITDFSNKLTQLIKVNILSHSQLATRVKTLAFWISVAEELMVLRNYSVVAIIMGAIDSNQIYRLKSTWAKIAKKTKSQMETLTKVVEPTSNYSGFRNKYKEENFIPFLGPLLTELLYIEERVKSPTPDGRVNFKKMRAISKVINIVRKSTIYQFKNPSHLDAYKVIEKFLKEPVVEDSEIYKMSYIIEPN